MQTAPHGVTPSTATEPWWRWRRDNGVVRSREGRRRRRRLIFLTVVVLLSVPVWSFARAVMVSNGDPFSANATEWARSHGLGWLVDRTEHFWYSHHQPHAGGIPRGGIPIVGRVAPTVTRASSPRTTALPAPLCPRPIPPIATPALANEGVWQPAGRSDGSLCFAYLRTDTVHTAYLAGVAWMNMKDLRATLHNGTDQPGGGPWRAGAQISPADYPTVEAAFNSGFRLDSSRGGYFTEGRTVQPLVAGRASLAIYSDGHVAIGAWGTEIPPSPSIVSVRQNLDLLVDQGHAVAGLSSSSSQWGATLGNKIFTWRSGVGIDAHGNLIYVAGQAFDVPSLAAVLQQAGCVRAMELDINPYWVTLMSFVPSAPAPGSTIALTPTKLLASMPRAADRYLHNGTRDFIELDLRR